MLNAAQNYSLEEMDRQSLIHPATSIADHLKNGPTIIAGGSGVRIKDRNGRELIDCGAGLWWVNIGYGRADIDAPQPGAAIDQLPPVPVLDPDPGAAGDDRRAVLKVIGDRRRRMDQA